jgi:hypothetical protein
MAKRGRRGVSEAPEGRSERPATGHGRPRSHARAGTPLTTKNYPTPAQIPPHRRTTQGHKNTEAREPVRSPGSPSVPSVPGHVPRGGFFHGCRPPESAPRNPPACRPRRAPGDAYPRPSGGAACRPPATSPEPCRLPGPAGPPRAELTRVSCPGMLPGRARPSPTPDLCSGPSANFLTDRG